MQRLAEEKAKKKVAIKRQEELELKKKVEEEAKKKKIQQAVRRCFYHLTFKYSSVCRFLGGYAVYTYTVCMCVKQIKRRYVSLSHEFNIQEVFWFFL